jgi:hypothetical protein
MKNTNKSDRPYQNVKDSSFETIRSTKKTIEEYIFDISKHSSSAICRNCTFFSSCLKDILDFDQKL